MVVGSTQLGSKDTPTIADSQGNTFILLASVSGGAGANSGIATLWYAIIGSSAADTVTITVANPDFIATWMQEVSGFGKSAIFASTGSASGGCCSISPKIVASGYTVAVVETQVTGVGTWTAASNFAKVYTNAGNEYSSQFESSVTQSGSTAITTTMSTSTLNWNMAAATLYSCAQLTVCSIGSASAQTNANTATPQCSVFSATSGNTIVVIVGSIGSGQTIHAPTDTGTNTFTLKHTVTDGNVPTPSSQTNVFSATVSSTLASDTISMSIDGTLGHGANFLGCYNVATNGALTLTFSDSSISTCQTNARCTSSIPAAVDHAGGTLFLNFVTEVLSGAALAGCPNLLTFADATGLTNFNNAEAYQCLSDPGAATNLNVPIDNYGTTNGLVCACTIPHYINNVTSGNTFSGTMAGVIIGFSAPSVISFTQSGIIPTSSTAAVLVVNGTVYQVNQLPASFTISKNTQFTYGYYATVGSFSWSSTSGCSQSLKDNTFIATFPTACTVTAVYTGSPASTSPCAAALVMCAITNEIASFLGFVLPSIIILFTFLWIGIKFGLKGDALFLLLMLAIGALTFLASVIARTWVPVWVGGLTLVFMMVGFVYFRQERSY